MSNCILLYKRAILILYCPLMQSITRRIFFMNEYRDYKILSDNSFSKGILLFYLNIKRYCTNNL